MVQATTHAGFLRSVLESEVAGKDEAAALASIIRTVDFFRNLNRQEAAARIKVLAAVVDKPALGRDMANELGLDASTVSRHVAALESDGLVQRIGETEDRRAQPILATESGREVLTAHLQRKIAGIASVLAAWAESDRSELSRLLDQLIDDLEAQLPFNT